MGSTDSMMQCFDCETDDIKLKGGFKKRGSKGGVSGVDVVSNYHTNQGQGDSSIDTNLSRQDYVFLSYSRTKHRSFPPIANGAWPE